MKKLLIAAVVAAAFSACGDNGNPSGTPLPDSSSGALSIPDTSRNAVSPGTDSTATSPSITDSAATNTSSKKSGSSPSKKSGH